jgi:two-component system, LytTR family, response regulator
MKITSVIVDDERRGRELLGQLLQAHCPEVEIKAMAATLDEAISAVNLHQPDVLFLDMRIGTDFGFDILPSLKNPVPEIVITTAYPEYAIKAVKIRALDYLLKPIVSDELKSVVRKVIELKSTVTSETSSTDYGNASERKISVASAEGLSLIKMENIIRCEAAGAYTEIFLKDGSKMVTSTNLGEFEKMLPEKFGFQRVHHSSIINMAEVIMYVKTGGGSVVMSDKSKVPISQRKKANFLEILRKYTQS